MRSFEYSYHERGFFRMNICGWRFAISDSRKVHVIYSDRTHGWKFGPFVVRINKPFPWPENP